MDRSTSQSWLAGGGEMGARMRALDWSQTPLGPIERWPQSLRSAVSILLPSKAQICLFWGPDLVAIYNDAYRPTLGRKHPWALGRPAREMWSEFWEDVLRPLLEGVLKTGEALWASNYPFALERHGFPEETYFDISYDPVRDESGGVGGVFCIVSETTGRVIGERRLRLLRDLGRATSGARSVDDVFRAAAGALAGDSPDVPFAHLLDPKGKALAACGMAPLEGWPLDRAADGGDAVLRDAELAALSPFRGAPWPGAAHTAVILPIATPGQAASGYLVAGISPRLVLDEGYRDFLRLIAAAIASGVAAARALEEQRAQAEALAEIDRAKTAFFSNVSHEFRTPLTLMLGPLEDSLADEAEPMPARQRERLELMRRNGVRLQRLVNTLLDFSRIEAGRAQASYAPTDLARFTAELASNFSTACEKAGLELRVDCPPLAQPVYVDRGMWEKIVLNLLSNAFKFTFQGGIEVRLAAAGQAVELRVRDSGIGIAAAELPRLFERFHRVEGARARTHEGSGIGLAFVRELAHLHGGDIRVESEPGRGSTFIVSLPFGHGHLPAERVVAAPASDASGAAAFVEEALGWLGAPPEPAAPSRAAAGDGAHILVVDDNADMREYVARLLRSRWRVTTAGNGRQALGLIAEHEFDLVISDVMMPQLDGLGLLQAIKSRPETADLPVVLLSARAGEDSRVDGMAAGADEYIVKPFTAQQLLAQVSAQLTIRQMGRRGAAERERLRREAEAANRAKDEFLAMLSHELRNPLAPISTAIQVMRLRGAAVPELGTLERQTAHLTRLVDDLLDVSRITRGKIELRKANVEIGDAVLRAMEMAGPLLEQRAHRVSIEGVPRRGLAVHGDAERLAQVLFNLLANAAKYSEPRSAIVVRAWRESDRVRLAVRDEGVGIAPDMLERVFDMFVQQGQTIERSQGGLGLGLTIVRSLVEMHGGRATARSAGPGQGSEFMIDLPAAPTVLPLARPAVRPRARPAAPAQRILVVDDNVDAAAALAELLRLLGHEVEVAHDGLRALAAARLRPDLALIDIGLPVMDGYELAGRLREQNPELRLVAVTGYGLDRDRERSTIAGFTDHLVKPIEMAMLERLLGVSSPLPAGRRAGDDRPAI
jgi:signal transduction histidine kinase